VGSEPDDPDVEDLPSYPIVEKYKSERFENLLFSEVDDLLVAVNAGRIRPNLLFGYDVGRDVNFSVLYGLEQVPMGDNILLITRFIGKLVQETIPNQLNYLDKRVMSRFLHARLAVDATGLGRGIGDGMEEKYPDRVDSILITDNWKGDMCPRLKTRMESDLLGVPNDREVKNHIYSIRRSTGRGGGFIYSAHGSGRGNQASPGKAHHGDIFWALVLANSMAPPITVSADTAISGEPLVGAPRDRKFASLIEVPIVGDLKGDRISNYELDLDNPVKFKREGRF
jgi:phage FluMu gp28-like protein